MKNMFQKGFKAVKEEEARKKKLAENRKGKLWRVFFPKNMPEDFEIPVRFLTAEPVCFYEHTVMINGKPTPFPCTGDGCEHCADGNKPRFVGAFLVIDRTEFEIDEKDQSGKPTGKKTKIKDRAKLLVRGQKDLAILDRLASKYGLLDRDWAISKTGEGTSTTWSFDRGEVDEWTNEEIQNCLPESLRGKDFYDIVKEQIMPSDGEDQGEDEEGAEESVISGVQAIKDDEPTPAETTAQRTTTRKPALKRSK